MQTFKEIPYQNYIELRFNQKNVNELSQQEALLKYKRNAQILTEIFTFDHKKREVYPSEDNISKDQIEELQRNVDQEQNKNQKELHHLKENFKQYQEISSRIKDIQSKEAIHTIIQDLKNANLYDDAHPFFIQDSPFYLATTEEECLEVSQFQIQSEENLNFLEIN